MILLKCFTHFLLLQHAIVRKAFPEAFQSKTMLSKAARATFDCAGAKIFFVFSIFDDHAVLCAVKSDKRKFKDKPFINRWSASQIKHITAKSNSKLSQKILFDIDYQSFAVVASLFVSRCRRSRWRFFCQRQEKKCVVK